VSLVNEEKAKFYSEIKLFRSVTEKRLIVNRNTVKEASKSIISQTQFILKSKKEKLKITGEKLQLQSFLNLKSLFMDLNGIEKNISNMSPQNVLKRGYSITRINGKALKNGLSLKEGDILNTELYEGNITSIVKK